MIYLPNIGLAGGFAPCDDNILALLNRNLLIIDSMMELTVEGFVDSLPESSEIGDVYLLNEGIYATSEMIAIYNGSGWIYIEAKEGFTAYNKADEEFYFYDGTEWKKGGGSLKAIQNTGTGVLYGCEISVSSDPSEFDIASGVYEVLDTTDPQNAVLTEVIYSGSSGNPVADIATRDISYILIDKDQNLILQATYPTPSERRAACFLGRLNHSNRTNITFANSFPDFKLNFLNQFYDLLDALAPFKIGGLNILANGANLSFNKEAGKAFFRSDNYAVDNQNPHYKTFNSVTAQPFKKITQTSTVDLSDVTVVDPLNYDNSGVVTALSGSGNQAQIMRIFQFKSGAVRVAYGQNVYPNLNAAVNGLAFDSFIPNPTIESTAILLGYLIIAKNCTSLANTTQCRIIQAARFDAYTGATGAGDYGGTVHTKNDLTAGFDLAIETSVKEQTWIIEGDSSDVSSSQTPFGTVEPLDGAEITVIGSSNSNPATILHDDSLDYGVINWDVMHTRGKATVYKYVQSLKRYVIVSN